MLTGYSIEPQQQKDEEVLIKEIGMGVNIDKTTGQKAGMFPLKSAKGNPLPCLKVKISDGSTDHRFEIRWSNYYEEMDENVPGKFTLVRVDLGKPLFLYVTNHDTNRKVMHKGNPCIDYVEVAKRWGSHYTPESGWVYGENHPRTEETMLIAESQCIEFLNVVIEMFGEDLDTLT